MTSERFNVVLQGSTLRGQDVATVATELAKLIKRDTDFAAQLLRGQPTKLKSGIDAATGARYIEAMERIGVAVRLEPETLEVDADLSARPVIANQSQTPSPAKIADARAAERRTVAINSRGPNCSADALYPSLSTDDSLISYVERTFSR